MSISLIQREEGKEEQEAIQVGGVPICGSNLSTPVVDTTQHIKEIHYKIGNRLYIENAC